MKILLIAGLPASGKSTYARKYCIASPNYIRINADLMRFIVTGDESDMRCDGAVWTTLERMADYLLSLGFSLVVENLNYHKKARKTWIDLAKKYLAPIDCLVIDTPYDVCLERNEKRYRKVPDFVFEKVRDNWEEPTIEEGFNEIIKETYNKDKSS